MRADHFIQAICGIGIRPNNRPICLRVRETAKPRPNTSTLNNAVQITAVIIGFSSCPKKLTESVFMMLFCLVSAMCLSSFLLIFQAEYEKQ